MFQPRLCVFTQTPLVRLLHDLPPSREPPLLSSLREGDDYLHSPGGVTRMVNALLRRLHEEERLDATTWMSLTGQGAARLRLSERVEVELVPLPAEERRRYAAAKGAVWEAVHGLRAAPGEDPSVPLEAVESGLATLSRAFARRAAHLHHRHPYDVFYVHDFQLLPLAAHLPSGVPRVFRWHIPVPEMHGDVGRLVVDHLNRYDAVIVSTQAYARRMRRAGVRVPVHASHPYLDESRCRVVTSEDLAAFDARWGLRPDDVAFACVARLDPMKSQDVAIRALARIAHEEPRAKLLLVGGGGFSGGRSGLGMPHASRWKEHLRRLAQQLGVSDRVVFTGGIADHELDVAYTRARAVLLPSSVEGFGLAAIEGWLYGRPVLVSSGAGVSELVEDDENGYAFPPGDDETLALRMLRLARDPDLAEALGEAGRVSARACHLRTGSDHVWDILREAAMAGPMWRAHQPRWR